MKEKKIQQPNENGVIIPNWSKDNWKKLPISQQPNYVDTELVNEITDKVFYSKKIIY